MTQFWDILEKAVQLARTRPGEVLSAVRGFALFSFTRLFLRLSRNHPGIALGKNVRLQRLRSFQVERGRGALLKIGDNSVIYENALIELREAAQVAIGANSILGDIRIAARAQVTIGSHFLSSWNVFIQDFDPHPLDPNGRKAQIDCMVRDFRPQYDSPGFDRVEPFDFDFPAIPIVIGSNVWVGANVSILKGVTIGDNCIIATGAVVTKGEYPANSILAGNPARVVRTLQS